MWAITNDTPLSANRTWVRDRDGSEVWLVAAKATFLIREDGSLKLAPNQEPVCLTPVYFDEPGGSSLRYDIDLVHRKPGTDIFVHGYACAPASARVTSIRVGFRVGDVAKELIAFGDRVWQSSRGRVTMSEPEPFDRTPVVWERAFGRRGTSEIPLGPAFSAAWNSRLGRSCPTSKIQQHSSAAGMIVHHRPALVRLTGTGRHAPPMAALTMRRGRRGESRFSPKISTIDIINLRCRTNRWLAFFAAANKWKFGI